MLASQASTRILSIWKHWEKEFCEKKTEKIINKYRSNNKKQILFLFLGMIFIFISLQIQQAVWKEIILITGWVPIWEMIRIELFYDVEGRRKRKIIKRLLKNEIIEKNI